MGIGLRLGGTVESVTGSDLRIKAIGCGNAKGRLKLSVGDFYILFGSFGRVLANSNIKILVKGDLDALFDR